MSSSFQREVLPGRARLHTLGRVAVDVDGGEDDEALASQTKRLAVLAYLAVARPRGFRQRDALVAMFWPELDQTRARAALRGALHKLRRSLGPNAIVSRGDEQIRIDETAVWCDVVAMEDAVSAGDAEAALALYGGKFLDGFHVGDAPGFDEWAASERHRLRSLAREAATACTRQRVAAWDLTGAVSTARRALEIDPLHEPSLQQVLDVLGKSGDRAEALRAADEFEARVGSELGAVLSPETRSTVHRLRAALSPPRETVPVVQSPAPATDGAISAPERVRSRRRVIGAAAMLAVATVAVTMVLTRRTVAGDSGSAASLDSTTRVYVARFESPAPNDSTSRILALMTSDLIGQGLSMSGGPRLIVQSGRTDGRDSALAEADRAAATLAVLGRVYRDGPRLVVASDLVRVPDGRVIRTHPSVIVADTALITGADSLRRLAMASVATVVDVPAWSRTAVERRLPSYEAYRAYVVAREADRQRDQLLAARLFERAAELDTGFTEALRGLIAMRMSLGEWGVADSILAILEARNRTEPRDVRFSDAILRARLHNDPAAHLEAIETLYAELGLTSRTAFQAYERGTALMLARRRADAVAMFAASPTTGSPRTGVYSYWITYAHALHLVGEHTRELKVGERGLVDFPGSLGINGARARAFIALGRESEALRVLEAVAGSPPGPGTWNQGSVFSIAAREARAHGMPTVERDARRRVLAWYAEQSQEERAEESVFFGASSLLYGAAAWPELAAQSELKIARDSMTISWHGYRGVAAAMMGDTARAALEDRWLAGRTESQMRRSLARMRPSAERAGMRARIAIARGDRQRAIELFREAASRGFLMDIELHSDPLLAQIAEEPGVAGLTRNR
jgi:DNA-binding SARP family transcriptional activator